MNRFSFNSSIFKAVKKDGRLIIYAKASDNMSDLHGDRFSKKALSMMKRSAKSGLPLRRSHSDAFEIGKSLQGRLRRSGDRIDFIVELELNSDYVEARQLFSEVENNKASRQLSIGGMIDGSVKDAVTFESDGEEVVRVINSIKLDHIAVTAPEYAANPRTGFVDAIMKSLVDEAKEELKNDILDSVLKAVVPFKKYDLADQDAEWEFSSEDGDKLLLVGSGVERMDEFSALDEKDQLAGWKLYKDAHAYFDDSDGAVPSRKSDYGLPHHKYDDGKMKTFFRGSIAGIASLNGARGGFSVKDDKERQGLYDHLAGHVKEFGAEPPELMATKDIELMDKEDLVRKFKSECQIKGIDIEWMFNDTIEVVNPTAEKEVNVNVNVNVDKDSSSVGELDKKLELFAKKIGGMIGKCEDSKVIDEITSETEEPTEESAEKTEDVHDVSVYDNEDISKVINLLHVKLSSLDKIELSDTDLVLLKDIVFILVDNNDDIKSCVKERIGGSEVTDVETKDSVEATEETVTTTESVKDVVSETASETTVENVTETKEETTTDNETLKELLSQISSIGKGFESLQKEIKDIKSQKLSSNVIDGQEDFSSKDESSFKGVLFGK